MGGIMPVKWLMLNFRLSQILGKPNADSTMRVLVKEAVFVILCILSPYQEISDEYCTVVALEPEEDQEVVIIRWTLKEGEEESLATVRDLIEIGGGGVEVGIVAIIAGEVDHQEVVRGAQEDISVYVKLSGAQLISYIS